MRAAPSRSSTPPHRINRFLRPANLRPLLCAYPDYRYARRWGMFLNTPSVLAVADQDQEEIVRREEIIRLVPEAHAVAEGSIWDLEKPYHRMVRTRDNATSALDMRRWLALVAGEAWMGLILVVSRPIHSHHRTRSPLTSGRRPVRDALGRAL